VTKSASSPLSQIASIIAEGELLLPDDDKNERYAITIA
jgi:hypothetical protein